MHVETSVEIARLCWESDSLSGTSSKSRDTSRELTPQVLWGGRVRDFLLKVTEELPGESAFPSKGVGEDLSVRCRWCGFTASQAMNRVAELVDDHADQI